MDIANVCFENRNFLTYFMCCMEQSRTGDVGSIPIAPQRECTNIANQLLSITDHLVFIPSSAAGD